MEGSVAKTIAETPGMGQDGLGLQHSEIIYRDERRLLIDRGHESHRDLDKWLLTLSGGAFGLSMTTLSIVYAEDLVFNIFWIICAWSFFGISITSVIVSIWASSKCYEDFRNIIDEAVCEGFEDWQEKARSAQAKSKWTGVIDLLNLIATICFAIGIVSLIVFTTTIS